MALYPLHAPQPRPLSQSNTTTQARLNVPTETNASPTEAKTLSPKIKDVVHSQKQKGNGLPWEAPTKHKFANKAEATSQDYRNPNADRDNPNVVSIDSTFSSSDVIDLNDKKANPEKGDVAQKVQIAALAPGDNKFRSVKINFGDKDSLQSVDKAIVKNIQVADDKRLTLSFQQNSLQGQGQREIKIDFPQKNLVTMTKGLDSDQKEQLAELLKKEENKAILDNAPELLEPIFMKMDNGV